MAICLILAAYIVVAGILYYKDRNMMTMLELYIRNRMPISEGMLRLSFLLMAASLPLMEVYSLCQRIMGKNDKLINEDSDMIGFIKEHYPETLENVEQATVVLDTIAEVDGFLNQLNKIFDKELDPLECQRVLSLARYAQKNVESNCRASAIYEGCEVPLIFKISRGEDAEETFQIDLFTRSDVMDKIDAVMKEYIEKAEQSEKAEGGMLK